VTTVRLLLVALLATLVWQPVRPAWAWAAVIVGLVVTALDGVDGWLARRAKQTSAFGARYDMETDALLIIVLAALVWTHQKAGAWVLASGLLRYGFVAGGWLLPWLARPLPFSRRRQTICVVQVTALLVALAPVVRAPLASQVSAAALAVLAGSFLIDIVWLWRRTEDRRAALLIAALVLLNASLSFENIWPTPFITWRGGVSIECAAVVLLMSWCGHVGKATGRWLGALWVVLVIGRYADVTAPSLWGREMNLYWDVRRLSAVTGMLTRVASIPLILLVVAIAVAVPVVLYRLMRWALRHVGGACERPRDRRVLAALAAAAIVLFALQRLAGAPEIPPFPTPVIEAYAHQSAILFTELTGAVRTAIPSSPEMPSNVARVEGADVLLFFLESYGAVSYDRPQFAERLAASRARFEADIRSTGRDVVSAYVESPTFGGLSWLAHISLLSGIEVRDDDTSQMLMTQKRNTMVTAFSRQGYRTVAIMPGLKQDWPEGSFYGFDDVYGLERLDYNGPSFGWFDIPDQFAIARLDALEVNRTPRKPLFVFYPTVSTHTPFTPTPPYQPDWARMTTNEPYERNELLRALSQQPDWFDFGPGYAQAFAYTYATIGGYLRLRADRDFVMILIGDHQPPAMVSGQGATHEVPVHIIADATRHRDVLDALRSHGFQSGFTPKHPSLTKMHALVPLLWDAFGKH
jgi:phosphatidylglycerophosphate synthase